MSQPCSRPPVEVHRPPYPSTVSGSSALRLLEELLEFPRAPGSPRRASSINAMACRLEHLGAREVQRLEHRAPDPYGGGSLLLVNLVAHYRPRAPRRFVLATHFDTRPWADEDPNDAHHSRPVPGANDGTSGLTLVFSLIPLLSRDLPPDVGFSVLLFDGEELGRPGALDGYCAGSRHVATKIRDGELPELETADFGVVLDMVGDRDLRLPLEPHSLRAHPRLLNHIWRRAAALGATAFESETHPRPILDDHVPLTEAGIPSVLLLDPSYPAWHTIDDTVDQIAPSSLEAVGQTLHHALVEWYAPSGPSACRHPP